ncbi:MAG: bifunctional pyr operon transcriptional regulator/uracil phosphoribosyltransferase PyrR [Clostridia bacterium]|nr:bifunctional pyr operon transcriptional regulator/uracil phosphoribosyltransferase PyrR [Clostridia bacterium]
MEFKAQVMNDEAMGRTLKRIAHEILERNKGGEELCFVGIHSRGVPISKRLARNIKEIEGVDIPCGTLNITLYRDDVDGLTDAPVLMDSYIPFDVKNKNIVLIDDVIFTGRTARAAMDALVSRGRPASIQLVAFVDRGHRELPIKPDYVGKNIPTSKSETVAVRIAEIDGADCVDIYTK